jgi:uncharacterized protein YabE (DUF348 family)
VPHVQKGAALIVSDQTTATLVAASALALGLFVSSTGAACAAAAPPAPAAASQASAPAAADDSSTLPISVSFVYDGRQTPVTTHARTVEAFLSERDLHALPGDYLSEPLQAALVDGMQLTYRPAVDVSIHIGKSVRVVRSTAGCVAELLAEQRIGLGAFDRVEPRVDEPLAAGTDVRVTRIDAWTAHERRRIVQRIVRQADANLAPDATRVLDPGAPGERDVVVRYERRDGGSETSTVLASHVLRQPRPKIIARGIAAYASLARVAEQGFASAVRLAGSALHMIATAYTGGCYGCSGVTATGVRAGLGVIAVDPSVIPLGTKLFIPGYGRAVAGDTGGSIVGHRIDLGFNNSVEALRWGRRPVTVYVLR